MPAPKGCPASPATGPSRWAPKLACSRPQRLFTIDQALYGRAEKALLAVPTLGLNENTLELKLLPWAVVLAPLWAPSPRCAPASPFLAWRPTHSQAPLWQLWTVMKQRSAMLLPFRSWMPFYVCSGDGTYVTNNANRWHMFWQWVSGNHRQLNGVPTGKEEREEMVSPIPRWPRSTGWTLNGS